MTRASRLVAAGVLMASIGVGPARAGVAPLKRSIENVTQGPLDAVLAPFTVGQTTYRNLSADNGSTGGKVFLAPVTYFALLIANSVASCFRTWTGALEFPVALGALAAMPFTDKDPPPFFDVKSSDALVEHPSEAFDVKFGVYHIGRSE